MSKQILPEAYFDSLSIAHKLDNFLDGFEQKEIHLFAYFSAILSHYSGNPTNEWKYNFIISPDKYPHSKDLNDAIERNLQNGYFEDTGNFLIISTYSCGIIVRLIRTISAAGIFAKPLRHLSSEKRNGQ